MILTILVGPYTAALGLALSMLIGNALSVCILQWLVMPILTRLLAPWLNATAPGPKSASFFGPLAIPLVLMALVVLFRQITG
jgi:antibiotic biosynthesis monooxygenase (ABM) superfamily enzyme